MNNAKIINKKTFKPEYFDCIKKIFEVYIKYFDVISENKTNKIRNKILMYQLFAILNENNILNYEFLDFIDNELSRIYMFCNIVLNEGQYGIDELLNIIVNETINTIYLFGFKSTDIQISILRSFC